MNEIEIFKNERFGEVRVAGTSDNPLFCLADVCKILGLRVDAVQSRLTDDPIRIGVTDSIGREQQMNFVNEKNLYKVIMRSDKPQTSKRNNKNVLRPSKRFSLTLPRYYSLMLYLHPDAHA